jgi:ferredoxin-type protein NapH
MNKLQMTRTQTQVAFFILFMVAPILDILRLDLNLGHFILFGQNWTLGLDAFQQGNMSAGDAAINLLLRVFLPLIIIAALLLGSAWKYGRLYCGWLCPHFSVVELINKLMLRASGKQSIWDPNQLPSKQADGSMLIANKRYWFVVILAVVFFAFLWAVTFLTYLLPPKEIYFNLFIGTLTRNQTIFLSVATFLLSIEFLFARHLFCRFACAVGVFQSLVWMGNKQAMVVGFNERKASECNDCNNACDNICPMRLKPRTVKRKMFTCTTCAQCISACDTAQKTKQREGILKWVEDECALPVSNRGFGHFPVAPNHCFDKKSQQPNSINNKKIDNHKAKSNEI